MINIILSNIKRHQFLIVANIFLFIGVYFVLAGDKKSFRMCFIIAIVQFLLHYFFRFKNSYLRKNNSK